MRSIKEIEKELELASRFHDSNCEKVLASNRPKVEEVFAASTQKLCSILQRELADAKAERAHELFGLKLHTPQFSPGTISLRVLSKLSSLLNDAIEQSAWREWDTQGDSPNIDEGFRKLLNLRLAGIKAGSTELVFLGNTAPDLTGESALESGLKNLFSVLTARNNEVPELIDNIGAKASKSIMQLMKEFEAENIGVEFSWSGPGTDYHWDGRPDHITRLRALLEEYGDSITENIEITGTVSSLNRRQLQIETDSGDKLNVRYNRTMAEKVKSLHLDEARSFRVERTTYPSDKIGVKRSAYLLRDIVSK